MVGADSLVMKDVPLHSIVTGIPTKVIGYVDDQDPSLNMKHDASKEFFQKVAISCKEARSNGPKPHTTLKPPDNGLKLNIDGSYNHLTKVEECWGVFRDSLGSWVNGYSARINVYSPLEAERTSLFFRLIIATNMEVSYMEITTDSLEVINSLDSLTQTNNNLTLSCRELLLIWGA
ncbi:hypothetical protein FXO37_08449 [Capsicum annuum]|nr:hypothetical protein FXO37_08449 [Capsicum annuum]